MIEKIEKHNKRHIKSNIPINNSIIEHQSNINAKVKKLLIKVKTIFTKKR